jgi:Delta7-sterol 5-desaturase
LVLGIMTVMGIGNHMGWEMFPAAMVNGPLGKWLITATHHEKHHSAYRGNYGLYFRFWDKICGTDIGLGRFAVPAGRDQHAHRDG